MGRQVGPETSGVKGSREMKGSRELKGGRR
jgi:hypothetical protein